MPQAGFFKLSLQLMLLFAKLWDNDIWNYLEYENMIIKWIWLGNAGGGPENLALNVLNSLRLPLLNNSGCSDFSAECLPMIEKSLSTVWKWFSR